jgi:hypothetical protein
MASKDDRRSQNFLGKDASQTHVTKRTNTYIREYPRTKRDTKNLQVKK